MDYYIENGVRRAVAARESKVSSLLAIVHESGKSPAIIVIKLEDLHSPKPSISRSDPRYVRAASGMSSAGTRARVPPIEVQPLGEPGQTSTVPLAQVALDP